MWKPLKNSPYNTRWKKSDRHLQNYFHSSILFLPSSSVLNEGVYRHSWGGKGKWITLPKDTFLHWTHRDKDSLGYFYILVSVLVQIFFLNSLPSAPEVINGQRASFLMCWETRIQLEVIAGCSVCPNTVYCYDTTSFVQNPLLQQLHPTRCKKTSCLLSLGFS